MSAAPFVWPLLPLLAWLTAVGIAALIVWRAVRGPRRAFREPVCGKCRYPVKGLAQLTCPECGSDLRHAGILVPASQFRRAWLVAGLIAWAAVVVLIGGPAGAVGAEALQHTTYTAVHTYTPKSGACTQAELTLSGRGAWSNGPAASLVRIAVQGSEGRPRLDWEPGRAPLSAEAILDLMTVAGADPRSPAVRAEAEELHRLALAGAETCRSAPLLTPATLVQAGVSAHTRSGPREWYAPVAIGALVAAWVAGALLIVRLRRRRMRAIGILAPAAPPAPPRPTGSP